MNKEPVNTPENTDHSQILNDTIEARIKAIKSHHLLDDTTYLQQYFREVNLANLSDGDKQVLVELIPYTSSLIIPPEIEENPHYKTMFDSINIAESNAGSNLLIPSYGQVPSDECIIDAVANFRSFTTILGALKVNDITQRTTQKLTAALAQMFVDIRYPVPVELLERLDDKEYESLKLISKMHIHGHIFAENEFMERNEKIRRGEEVELPLSVQFGTNDRIQQILDIYADVDVQEHLKKTGAREAGKRQLVKLYMEFTARYPDLRSLTSFLINNNGTAQPLEESE